MQPFYAVSHVMASCFPLIHLLHLLHLLLHLLHLLPLLHPLQSQALDTPYMCVWVGLYAVE